MIKWKKLRSLIPNSVQVSKDAHYEIVWADDFKDNAVLGETRFDPKQIVLNKNQSAKETLHTYFHELLHAYSAEYDATLTESQVRALEKSLYFLIKKNNLFKESK